VPSLHDADRRSQGLLLVEIVGLSPLTALPEPAEAVKRCKPSPLPAAKKPAYITEKEKRHGMGLP